MPRAYAGLLDDVICHRAEDRFALLYDVLWRLKHGEPELLSRASDPADRKACAVCQGRASRHPQDARLPPLSCETDGRRRNLHRVVRAGAFHSATRDAVLRGSFRANAVGDRHADRHRGLGRSSTCASTRRSPSPTGSKIRVLDDLWRTYYRTIFNPARLNTQMMTREMPRKYWRNMPETALIPELVSGARERVHGMDRIAGYRAAISPRRWQFVTCPWQRRRTISMRFACRPPPAPPARCTRRRHKQYSAKDRHARG